MTPSSAPSFECSLRAHWRMGLFLLVVAVPSVFLAATTLRVATAFTLGERGGLTERQRALSLDPANPEIHRRLGLVECYLSDPPDLSEGVKQLRQATELAPLRPLYWSDLDRKSTRLNSSHPSISYAVFCLKKKKIHSKSKRILARRNLISHLTILV